MPQLMKYTPDEIERGRKLLETWNVDRINEEYYKGEITLREKRDMTKTLGNLKKAAVADGGVTGQKEIDVYLKGIADSYGKIFNKETGDTSLYHTLMTALEVLKATDIPGDVVERKLLEFGAPPKMARAANWLIWLPTNFLSTSTLLAPFTKGAGALIRGVKAGKSNLDDVLKFVAKQSDDVGKSSAKMAKEEGKLVATLDAGLGKSVGEAVKAGEKKAGTILFRGGSAVDPAKMDDFGISLSLDKSVADQFAKDTNGITETFELARGTKLEKLDDLMHQYAKELIEKYEKDFGKSPDTVEDVVKEMKNVPTISAETISQWARGKGIKAIDMTMTNGKQIEREIRILDPKLLTNITTGSPVPVARDANKFADDLAESFGVNVDEIQRMIQKPMDLENASAQKLFEFYREKAQEQIRKGVSHELTGLQSVGAISYDDLVQRMRGAGMTAAQAKEAIFITDQVTRGLDDLVDKALPIIDEVAAGNRPDIIAAFKAHIQAATNTIPATLGGTGEIGRGLNILKTTQPELAGMRAWNNVLDALGGDSIVDGTDAMIAKTMQRMSLLSKEQKTKFLAEATTTTEPSRLHNWYKSLLFLSPSTHLVNVVGTSQGIASKLVEHTGSALVPFNTGAPSARAAFAAWAGTFDAYSHLPTLLRKARGITSEKITKAELAAGAPMDAVTRFGPLRWLGIEDEVLSAGIENGFIKSQLIDDALARGIPKDQLGDFVNAQLLKPEVYTAMAERVKPMVDEAVFHGALSETSDKIVGAIRNSALDYYLPVLKTPINLLKMERDWTPGLQLFSKKIWQDFEAGGAREAAARSRMTLSWMMANSLWSAAKAGVITGGGPEDPDANRIWRQHNQPYTINGWSYRQFEPLASVVGVIADMAHMTSDMPEESTREAGNVLQLSMMRMLENNYWLRIMEGVTGVVRDVKNSKGAEDTMGALGKLVLSPAITVASGGPVGNRVREIIDPEIKSVASDLSGLFEHYKSKVPGWSKSIRPRLNLDGQPDVIPPSMGGRAANVALSGVRYKDQVSEVASILTKHDLIVDDDWKMFGSGRKEYKPGRVPRTDTDIGVELSQDEQHDYKKLALSTVKNPDGRTWVEAVKALDADPNFQKQNRIDKQRELNLLYSEFRDIARDTFVQLSPKLAGRVKRAEVMSDKFRSQETPESPPVDDVPLPTYQEIESEPQTAEVAQ